MDRLDFLKAPNYHRLRKSIQEKGILSPVIASSDGTVIDGNHRVSIAREVGILVPTVYLDAKVIHVHPSKLTISDAPVIDRSSLLPLRLVLAFILGFSFVQLLCLLQLALRYSGAINTDQS